MAFTVTPLIGVDLSSTVPVAVPPAVPPFRVGTQVWADDGKRYVYAKAGAAITASTAVCTVNASTFAVTATGGAYTSPAVAMANGDYGWFAAASV